MYYLYLEVKGEMLEYTKDESFHNIMDVVRGIGKEKSLKIIGLEGEWHRPANTPFKFIPTKFEEELK